jgi:hypothetical protein
VELRRTGRRRFEQRGEGVTRQTLVPEEEAAGEANVQLEPSFYILDGTASMLASAAVVGELWLRTTAKNNS